MGIACDPGLPIIGDAMNFANVLSLEGIVRAKRGRLAVFVQQLK
jgi:flavin-dependent dehydrogenase